MTRADVATMLSGIGLPYAYDHFTEADAPGNPPFICFIYGDSDDAIADDSNYQAIVGLTVELYVDAPDFAKEAAVEAALSGAGLVYAKSGPAYIESERMYQTNYTTSVLLTEEPPAAAGGEENNITEVAQTNAE